MRKRLLSFFAFLGLIGALAGSPQAFANVALVNTQTFGLTGINDIGIYFISDNITFFKGVAGKIVIKEYMSEGNKRHYAKSKRDGKSLVIRSGERPLALFNSYLEVYLPSEYTGQISMRTDSGSVKSKVRYNLQAFSVESQSGDFEFENLSASVVEMKTESGSILCSAMSGNISTTSSSGNLRLTKIKGYGKFYSDSGNISIGFAQLTGNVNARTESGTISLDVPSGASFKLQAVTDNGNIESKLSGKIKADESSVHGSIGSNPEYTVGLLTTSGNISIK